MSPLVYGIGNTLERGEFGVSRLLKEPEEGMDLDSKDLEVLYQGFRGISADYLISSGIMRFWLNLGAWVLFTTNRQDYHEAGSEEEIDHE